MNGKLIAGGSYYEGNNLVVWDGQTWEVLEGGTNDRVNALASDGVNLYVGGNFTMAGNVPSNHIASIPLAVLPTQTEASPELPSGASLQQAYPNPFGRSTTVPFTLDQPGAVTLRVFDVLGRSVAVLADGAYPDGAHAVTWDAAGLANGVYLVRFDAPGTTQTRRLVVSH